MDKINQYPTILFLKDNYISIEMVNFLFKWIFPFKTLDTRQIPGLEISLVNISIANHEHFISFDSSDSSGVNVLFKGNILSSKWFSENCWNLNAALAKSDEKKKIIITQKNTLSDTCLNGLIRVVTY